MAGLGAERFTLVQDCLVERLCGRAAIDVPNASRMIFYDILERKWGTEQMAIVGVDERRAAEARESGALVGALTPEAA